MINLGNIEIADLRLGASQVKALCLGSEQIWGGEEPAPVGDWLCFTAEQASSTLHLDKDGSPDTISLETSTDGSTWTDYSWSGNTGDTLTLANVGDKLYMRAKTENQTISKNGINYYKFIMSGKIAASGNIQTLLKADGSRTDAPTCCYNFMFRGCKSLTTAPSLPAMTLASSCYQNMFSNCTSLTTAPKLPATTLAPNCYNFMFSICTALSSVEVAFTTWTSGTTDWWLNNVAASGTFTCPAELPDTRGAGNIPEGWQVVKPTIAVEYIESDGTQYINTGINGNTVYGVEFSFMAPAGVEQTTAWANPLASVMDNFTLGFYDRNNSTYFLRWRTQEVFQATAYAGTKQTLEISRNTITFGDSSYTIATPQPVCTASGNIMICANTALSRLAKIKIYGLKLYDSSFNLLRDLVPVRVGNVGYMYDNVSGELFGNDGTGAFIIGPDV